METTIEKCKCKHEYQDKEHGEGNRVHNIKTNKPANGRAVCTSCGTRKN